MMTEASPDPGRPVVTIAGLVFDLQCETPMSTPTDTEAVLRSLLARREIGVVNLRDQLGPGEREQFVIAFHITRVTGKLRAAVLLFGEPVLLNHGAHRAIQNEDAAGKKRTQDGFSIGGGRHRCFALQVEDQSSNGNNRAPRIPRWLCHHYGLN